MSIFTDLVMITWREKKKKKGEERERKKKNASEESERQISASLVLQCIRTGITVPTAAPAGPLTEKNYKYYHLDH